MLNITWSPRVLHEGSSAREIQPNLSFRQVELTTWLSSFRYQHIAILVVNYGISNTVVLEIPQFTTKSMT